ncbi:MAG: helix-turn-helix transcriptional regulator [Bacteroidetes bacterium]|jgi:AraC-like DNA-binding protein|nr:helix-turn-helix transcriptional regulator [Bacteroidota bacterium]
MEYVFEKILVPHQHSFISREILLAERLPKIHSHKNYELNYIVSGSGRRIVGDNISSFEKNDLVLLGPEVPHSWEIIESQRNHAPSCITTHFYENIISSDFFNIPELEKVEELLKRANRGISFRGSKIKKISAKLERLVDLDGLESYIELLKIFNDLLQVDTFEYLTSAVEMPDKFTKDLDRINRVYEYVFLNIEESIKLEDVAGLLHMAPGSFCRYFKKKTNRTFTQYVKGVRIGIAAKMLIETEKSVTQICYDSGYNNLANFNHYFKSLMNKTPSDYRKNFR